MFFGFGKSTKIKEFAKALAEQVAKRYPPALDSQAGRRPSVSRLTRITEDACRKAMDFQTENKVGWIGKAVLGNAFRWELTELGYTKEFVDFATEAVVVHMSRPDLLSKSAE